MRAASEMFKYFLAVLAMLAFIMVLKECSSHRMNTNDPKRIIKKERIGENSEEEFWRVSVYELSEVKTDTLLKFNK